MGAWESFKKAWNEADIEAEKNKVKKQERVANAEIQVGDQVILTSKKGVVKKGTKGVCTKVTPVFGDLVYEIMFNHGFITGNMTNNVTLRFTEFQRKTYLVKINS